MFESKPEQPQELPFQFTGRATEYFGIWIVNLLLTVLTLGIYSAWAKVRTRRYFYSNTLLDGSPFDYLASPIAILKGWLVAVLALVVYNVVTGVLPITSLILFPLLLIAIPWVVVRSMRFHNRNSAWRNIRFGFKKSYGEAAKIFILYMLLTVLTLGLFIPYYYFAINRFFVNNSGYGTTAFKFHAKASDFYKIFIKPSLAVLLILLLVVALSFSKLKEFYEQYAAMIEAAQTVEQPENEQPEDMSAEEQEEARLMEEYERAMQEQMETMQGQEATMETDEPVPDYVQTNPEAPYEEQHAELMQQAMQDLAQADAELEATEVQVTPLEDPAQDAAQATDMADEEYVVTDETLSSQEDEMGSGDEAYYQEQEVDANDPAPVSAPEDDEDSIAAMIAMFAGMAVFFGMFIFYFVFMVYIQSRVTNLVFNHTELAGHRFRSSLRARDLLWLYFTNLLVISLSFGLMIPWTKIRMARYRASKLVFLPVGNLDTFMQAQQEKINALGEELGDVFDLDIGI